WSPVFGRDQAQNERLDIDVARIVESSMEISLSGRSAIVTGASKGIGLGVATRFAQSGADVAIVARGREGLDAAVKAIGAKANVRVVGVHAHVGGGAHAKRGHAQV